MSTSMKLLVAAIGGTILFAIIFALVLFGFYNSSIRQENGLEAQYKQNQNNYSNYFSSLKEMAQVPSMYTEDLQKVYDGAMKGRYGADGSKALVQFIQEHNPNFDSSMYSRLQTHIAAGRQSFEADQKTLLDKKRVYLDHLETGMGAIFSGVMGFPRKDLSVYDIVTNAETQEAFTTKKAAPIQLR